MKTLKLTLAACVHLVAIVGLAADRRPITETDILKFQWVADPQISPDGREVAYVLVTVNEKLLKSFPATTRPLG